MEKHPRKHFSSPFLRGLHISFLFAAKIRIHIQILAVSQFSSSSLICVHIFFLQNLFIEII